jgi:hypothetical protein
VAQEIEHLLSEHEALSSNFSTGKKKKKRWNSMDYPLQIFIFSAIFSL